MVRMLLLLLLLSSETWLYDACCRANSARRIGYEASRQQAIDNSTEDYLRSLIWLCTLNGQYLSLVTAYSMLHYVFRPAWAWTIVSLHLVIWKEVGPYKLLRHNLLDVSCWSDSFNFISRCTVIIGYYLVLLSPLSPFHWLQNTWPWMTLNGHFALNSVLCRYRWSSEAWLSKLGYSWTCSECLENFKPKRTAQITQRRQLDV